MSRKKVQKKLFFSKTLDFLEHYLPEQALKSRNTIETYRDAPLIYTVIKGNRDRMSIGNIERIIRKYSSQIRNEHPDLPEKCYPHMMRRTRATNLYQDGTELELVSRILGHSSTETTRIYAVPSIEMMRKAMETGSLESDEKPLWADDETEMARICGLR